MTFTRVDQVPCGEDWELEAVDICVEKGENYSDMKGNTKKSMYI